MDENNKSFPFLIVDALVIKVRLDDRVVSTSALVASGVNNQAQRDILGLKLADSESKESWSDMFSFMNGRLRSLKNSLKRCEILCENTESYGE
ncbi:MAG: transposase [Mariprofundus sp.]|nr:transposase [Mariprofundus sp.]